MEFAATIPPYRDRFAMYLAASSRTPWEIERDVIRGRALDHRRMALPESITRVHDLQSLSHEERCLLSQVQARTWLRIVALADRCMRLHALQAAHAAQNESAGQALAHAAREKQKHIDLFHRLDVMLEPTMPPGYFFEHDVAAAACTIAGHSPWAVLGFALHAQLSSQAHYRASLAASDTMCPVWKDVLLFHWKEEALHAVLTEALWRAEHERLDALQRERALDDLLGLIGRLDTLLAQQAEADSEYFLRCAGWPPHSREEDVVHDWLWDAYRGQHISSGMQEPRFVSVLGALLTPAQQRLWNARATGTSSHWHP
jgi:hypothetical protein